MYQHSNFSTVPTRIIAQVPIPFHSQQVVMAGTAPFTHSYTVLYFYLNHDSTSSRDWGVMREAYVLVPTLQF